MTASPPPAAGSGADRWRALVADRGPVLADGAMGTMLFDAGLQFGDPPEVWNLTRPDVVRGIHRGYLDAGARIVLTNTFGGNRFRLTPLTGRTHQLRVHMNAVGAPIVNDPWYPVVKDVAAQDFTSPLQLLAHTLEFDDPISGQRRRFVSGRALTGG